MERSDAGPWRPADTADGSRTLFDARYGQTLHSSHGAVTESRWVFLHGSGVADRLAARSPTRVLEVGFGTGLNFLLTADLACTLGTEARYTALDRTLPPAELVAQLGYERHVERPALVSEIWNALGAAARPDLDDARPHSGTERQEQSQAAAPNGSDVPPEPAWSMGADPDPAAEGARRVRVRSCGATLDLCLGEATDAPIEAGAYHAVYHDGFSPDANPELWREPFLERLAAALAPGGVLTTYTVKGAVRRSLAALGLEVQKRSGPPNGKREMLWARKPLRARG